MLPPRIAVVHMDSSVSNLLMTLLEEEGYLPVLCADPASALEKFQTAKPDLAIIDLGFGDGNPSWTLVDGLRTNPVTQHIPIIALTTSTDLEAARPQSCQHNCEVLPEPFDINHILGMIRSLLKSPHHCRCG